jgi:NADH-quinone oxidoreductase subunit C
METLFHDEGLRFDYLRCQSGVDYLTELESVYHLYSFTHKHKLAVKVRCPYEDAHVPTVSHLWAAANWHERETHEMFGIVFDGHPDLTRIMMPDDWEGHPLRKTEELGGVPTWYVGATVPPIDQRGMA